MDNNGSEGDVDSNDHSDEYESETFNSYILNFRDEPIIDMLEDIRKHLMARMHDIAKDLHSCTDILCPNIRKKIEKIQTQVKNYDLIPSDGTKYEVHNMFNKNEVCIVDLASRECSCRWWMLTGIPCVHALTCIFYARDDLVTYVDKFYNRSNAIETYKHGLSPMGGPLSWPSTDGPPILPPEYVRPPGRPKKRRIRDPTEVEKQSKQKWTKAGIKMSCRRCGQLGHNIRTCREPAPDVEPTIKDTTKRKVGRPKKNVDETSAPKSKA